jgi:UDP:flavonoid glycosyltransferase YjiC (YdhE family)
MTEGAQRVLFVTWAGGGNVNPVLALGAQLLARGHEPRVLGSASLVGRFSADGVPFVAREPEREWDLAATADDVRHEVERVPTDLAVVDYMQPAALCGAERAGVPTAALVHTLYGALFLRGEFVPMTMAAGVDAVNDLRASLDLPAVDRVASLLDLTDRVIVAVPEALDMPRRSMPANVTYVGPVLEAAGPDADWEPPGNPSLPLVAVSLGTTPMDEVPLLQRVLDALAPMPVRVVATLGDHVDTAAVDVPANATLAPYIRHAAVLPHVAAFVTHAGLGGVMAAGAHGVPMVCLPLGREQPQNAAAVERAGAGLSLPADAPVADIRRAAAAVLDDATYRRGAGTIADAIASYGNGRACVEAIETVTRACGTRASSG